MEPLLSSPPLLDALLDPAFALASSALPVAAPLARFASGVAASRRRALLVRHGLPLVSVVVAAWNAEDTIDKAIESLASQTYSKLEIIIVDDASSDSTQARAKALAKQDDRIKLVCSARNRGAAAARNRGLAIAQGEFVSFQDADDISAPERIEQQLFALLRCPKAVVCICNYQRFNQHNRVQTINGKRTMKARISMLFHRKQVMSRLGFFLELVVGEDSEYYERMLAAFGPKAVVEVLKPLYRARYSPDSLLFGDGLVEVVSEQEIKHTVSETSNMALSQARQRHRGIRSGTLSAYVALESGSESSTSS